MLPKKRREMNTRTDALVIDVWKGQVCVNKDISFERNGCDIVYEQMKVRIGKYVKKFNISLNTREFRENTLKLNMDDCFDFKNKI